MTFSFVSSGSDDGSFDCDTVIQSVTILGMERKPSTVAVHVAGNSLTYVRQNMVTSGKIKAAVGFIKKGILRNYCLYSGATDKTAGFQYVEMCSTLTVNSLNLRASVDWEIKIL